MFQLTIEKNNITTDAISNLLNNIKRIKSANYNSITETAYVICDENSFSIDEVEIIPNLLKKTKTIDYISKLKVCISCIIDLIKYPRSCKFIADNCPYIVEYFLEEKPELFIEYTTDFARTQTTNEISSKVEKIKLIQEVFVNHEIMEPFVFVAMVLKFYQQNDIKKFKIINGTKHTNTILREYKYINQLLSNPDPILSTYKIDTNYSNCITRNGYNKMFTFADQDILSATNFKLYHNLPEFKMIDYIANR